MALAATFREPREHLLQWLERRLPALTRWRVPEPLPIALHPRRIYVLPTRFGLLFGAMLVMMLLGALNFNNNAALLLTFLLSGAVLLSMGRGVRMLDGLRLVAVDAAPVPAGSALSVALRFEAGDSEPRRQIELIHGRERWIFDLDGGAATVRLTLPTERRGLLPIGRLTLACEYPFGLFRAWSVVHPDVRLLVHPRPEAKSPPLPRGAAGDAEAHASPAGEEWHALREYRHGDPRRLIAWRASARAERLLVREFATPRAARIEIAWEATAGLPHEQRISRLARWVLEAARGPADYALRLPGETLGPGRGPVHLARCLRALALLP